MDVFREAYVRAHRYTKINVDDLIIVEKELDNIHENLNRLRYKEMLSDPRYDHGYLKFLMNECPKLRKEFEAAYARYCMSRLGK